MLPSLWKPEEELFPLMNLRREINRVFEGFLGDRPWLPARPRWDGEGFLPTTDVRETEDAVVVDVELPGMKPQDIQVQVEENILCLRGERKQEKEERSHTYHRMERSYGRFERRIELPTMVDAERIDASYANGVLHVTVPKKAGAKPKSITVKVK